MTFCCWHTAPFAKKSRTWSAAGVVVSPRPKAALAGSLLLRRTFGA